MSSMCGSKRSWALLAANDPLDDEDVDPKFRKTTSASSVNVYEEKVKRLRKEVQESVEAKAVQQAASDLGRAMKSQRVVTAGMLSAAVSKSKVPVSKPSGAMITRQQLDTEVVFLRESTARTPSVEARALHDFLGRESCRIVKNGDCAYVAALTSGKMFSVQEGSEPSQEGNDDVAAVREVSADLAIENLHASRAFHQSSQLRGDEVDENGMGILSRAHMESIQDFDALIESLQQLKRLGKWVTPVNAATEHQLRALAHHLQKRIVMMLWRRASGSRRYVGNVFSLDPARSEVKTVLCTVDKAAEHVLGTDICITIAADTSDKEAFHFEALRYETSSAGTSSTAAPKPGIIQQGQLNRAFGTPKAPEQGASGNAAGAFLKQMRLAAAENGVQFTGDALPQCASCLMNVFVCTSLYLHLVVYAICRNFSDADVFKAAMRATKSRPTSAADPTRPIGWPAAPVDSHDAAQVDDWVGWMRRGNRCGCLADLRCVVAHGCLSHP
jgi:hypothetical protein